MVNIRIRWRNPGNPESKYFYIWGIDTHRCEYTDRLLWDTTQKNIKVQYFRSQPHLGLSSASPEVQYIVYGQNIDFAFRHNDVVVVVKLNFIENEDEGVFIGTRVKMADNEGVFVEKYSEFDTAFEDDMRVEFDDLPNIYNVSYIQSVTPSINQ